jgi:hypothetical protein
VVVVADSMGGVVAVAVGGAVVWVAAVGALLQVLSLPCLVLLLVASFCLSLPCSGFCCSALYYLAEPYYSLAALPHILCSLCGDYALTSSVTDILLPRSYFLIIVSNLSSRTFPAFLF